MSNDRDPNDPWSDWKSDVPETAGSAIVKDPGEARRLARRMAGQDEKRCLFNCVTCGWEKTLEFEDDEIAALNGSVRNYSGPCVQCGAMTLIPKDEMFGGEKSILELATQNRRVEYEEAADVFLDKAAQKIGEVMGMGGAPAATGEKPTPSPSAPDGVTPAWVRDKADDKG
jgi:hypothetical protein